MLAYVFWHRMREDCSKDIYENKIIKFQSTLAESHLVGFKGSVVARIDSAPWLASHSEAYEDWYLLDGSEVLDKLNDVAVSGSRKGPHNDVAHLATDFHGGLYQLRTGSEYSVSSEFALWLSKPAGSDYESFYRYISQNTASEKSSLWRRQMVLGPTPEFCMIGTKMPDLPSQFSPVHIHREIIWETPRL